MGAPRNVEVSKAEGRRVDPLMPTEIHIFLKFRKSTSIKLRMATHMPGTGEEGDIHSGPLKEYSRKIR